MARMGFNLHLSFLRPSSQTATFRNDFFFLMKTKEKHTMHMTYPPTTRTEICIQGCTPSVEMDV